MNNNLKKLFDILNVMFDQEEMIIGSSYYKDKTCQSEDG